MDNNVCLYCTYWKSIGDSSMLGDCMKLETYEGFLIPAKGKAKESCLRTLADFGCNRFEPSGI